LPPPLTRWGSDAFAFGLSIIPERFPHLPAPCSSAKADHALILLPSPLTQKCVVLQKAPLRCESFYGRIDVGRSFFSGEVTRLGPRFRVFREFPTSTVLKKLTFSPVPVFSASEHNEEFFSGGDTLPPVAAYELKSPLSLCRRPLHRVFLKAT